MKFSTGFLPGALAGLAVAGTQNPAEVYLFGSSQLPSSEETAPRISKEVARHIFLQRTSRDRYGNALGDIPSTTDQETALSHINQFGKGRPPLFGYPENEAVPAQLVVMLEGITKENVQPLKEALAKTHPEPAFSIADPPSSMANSRLLRDLQASGASSRTGCTLASAINPNDDSCWKGASSAVKFDVRKVPNTIDTLVKNLDRLLKFIAKGELEAALVLMPESSRSSGANFWATNPSTAGELRRRSTETVLSDGSLKEPATTSWAAGANTLPFARQEKDHPSIPHCFSSKDSCMTRTNNCTGGHGECKNKYGDKGGEKEVCFACVCAPEVIEEGEGEDRIGRKTVKWGGNMCQKKDVSTEFWLIAGLTVLLVGVVSFSIGLLFNIGEEKLPGVIGAGVSRSK